MASVVGIRWTNENRFRLLFARVTFSFSDGTAKAQPETLKYKYFIHKNNLSPHCMKFFKHKTKATLFIHCLFLFKLVQLLEKTSSSVTVLLR